MARLVIFHEGSMVKTVPLTKAKIRLGRRPHNDVHLDGLAVSGQHAEITLAKTFAMIEDMGSTNGTYVNGIGVQRKTLHDGDMIVLGNFMLKFLAEPAVLSPSEPVTSEVASTPALDAAPAVDSAEEGAPTVLVPMPAVQGAHLQILSGVHQGKNLPLLKEVTTIGKTNSVIVQVKRQGNRFVLVYQSGLPMPVVNGIRMTPDTPCPLRYGDIVDLADVKLRYVD